VNVSLKTCGCGNQWKPMSKLDTRCWKCLRKDAEALMEARKHELQPNGMGPGCRLGDRVAMGAARPAPLRVPVYNALAWTPEEDGYETAKIGDVVLETKPISGGRFWFRTGKWGEEKPEHDVSCGLWCLDFAHNCQTRDEARKEAEKSARRHLGEKA